MYDISIDLVEQFSMLDAIDFAQTLQFSQVSKIAISLADG